MPAVTAGRRERAGNGARLGARAALPLLALALPGCVSMHGLRLGQGEDKVLVGPGVRDNRTPMDGALACYAGWLASRENKPLVIAVGDVRDYTGKYSVSEGNAITQGGSLMVASALGKLRGSVRVAERFDPVIAERELGYTDKRQLGDGAVHDLAGPSGKQVVPWLPYYGGSITASDYYIVGGITEVNYNIRSGGAQIGINAVGPKMRTYTEQVAIDLRIVDTRTLVVVKMISLAKQFTGYENGIGTFNFFGSNLFDINIGAKGQEPLQLGIRAALEEATMRLVGAVAHVDPEPCMSQASWAAPVPAEPPEGSANPARAALRPDSEPTSLLSGTAFNDEATGPIVDAASDLVFLFEVGSDNLPGSATAVLDRIAARAAHGPVSVRLLARDTETLDPIGRQSLTDHRIAAIVAELGKRGILPGEVSVTWRPDAANPATVSDGAGLQRLARLTIG